jgi:hypothetical protein
VPTTRLRRQRHSTKGSTSRSKAETIDDKNNARHVPTIRALALQANHKSTTSSACVRIGKNWVGGLGGTPCHRGRRGAATLIAYSSIVSRVGCCCSIISCLRGVGYGPHRPPSPPHPLGSPAYAGASESMLHDANHQPVSNASVCFGVGECEHVDTLNKRRQNRLRYSKGMGEWHRSMVV